MKGGALHDLPRKTQVDAGLDSGGAASAADRADSKPVDKTFGCVALGRCGRKDLNVYVFRILFDVD